MSNVLTKSTVLVLNRNWQAINIRTPAEAFCQMATGVATALEIQGDDHMRPVSWEEWVQGNRVELNAFTTPELMEWLDRKMTEHGAVKLIPPNKAIADEFEGNAS